jgi:hypothetical protein
MIISSDLQVFHKSCQAAGYKRCCQELRLLLETGSLERVLLLAASMDLASIEQQPATATTRPS